MIILHGQLSLRFALFCLSLFFFLNCSTGPEFIDLSEAPETAAPFASDTVMHSGFGGWRGTSTSEHFMLTGLDSNSMLAVNVGGDVFNLSPEGGVSAYLQ